MDDGRTEDPLGVLSQEILRKLRLVRRVDLSFKLPVQLMKDRTLQ